MAVFQYRNRGTNQVVYVESALFDGNPLWEPIVGGGGGGDVTEAELTAHETDSTAVHGIANTALLATLTDAQDKADAAAAVSIPLVQKGAASGVATLDSGGKLTAAQVPNLSIINYLGQVANQTAMLALVGQPGEWTTRTDLGTSWLITGSDPTQLADWTQLSYPSAPVTSVAGKTGVVTLAGADIASGTVAYARLPVGTTASTVTAGDDTRVTGAAQKASNLSDLASATTARTNLGLGGAATLAVGTTAGTVAAGDDSRITGAASAAALTSGLALKADKRTVTTLASSSTPTPTAVDSEHYSLTALAVNATFGAPTGTPSEGQQLLISIKDNGTARTLSWNAIYRAVGVALPTTTVISKMLYVGAVYCAADSRWDVLAVGQEA